MATYSLTLYVKGLPECLWYVQTEIARAHARAEARVGSCWKACPVICFAESGLRGTSPCLYDHEAPFRACGLECVNNSRCQGCSELQTAVHRFPLLASHSSSNGFTIQACIYVLFDTRRLHLYRHSVCYLLSLLTPPPSTHA